MLSNKNSFTYRQKNYALLLIVFILAWASYKRSFSLTIDARKESKELDQKIEGAKRSKFEKDILKKEVALLTSAIGSETLRADFIQQSIMSRITELTDTFDIRVQSIDQIHSFKTADYIIFSNMLVLKGDFQSLFEVISSLEQYFDDSRICSVEYFKKRNRKTKKDHLYARIIFQNYSRN